jgi:hypothetical protein
MGTGLIWQLPADRKLTSIGGKEFNGQHRKRSVALGKASFHNRQIALAHLYRYNQRIRPVHGGETENTTDLLP